MPAKTQASDQELVSQVLGGDHNAFQPLVERYQQPLFGYLYRLLGNDRTQAEDLLQTVFLKAFQSLASYRPERPLAPWLYRIAHNEAANWFRHNTRKPETPLDDSSAENQAAATRESPEALENRAQEIAALQAALEQLPAKQREAVRLHYFEELPYDQVAQVLGVRPGTVGTLLNRARSRLESLLADLNPGAVREGKKK